MSFMAPTSSPSITEETMKWAKDTSNLWVVEEIKANKMVEIDRANEESNCFGFAATVLKTGHLLPSGGASAKEAAFDAMFADHDWRLPVLLPPEGPQLVLYKAPSDIGFAGHAAVWMVYAPHDTIQPVMV